MNVRRVPMILAALLLPTLLAVSPASAETNADGSFSYSIPIPLPPGRAGVAPTLSLEYNSRSGNGDLGVGWALSGIDKISRVRGPNGENPTYQFSSSGGMITQDALHYRGQRMIRIAPGEYRLRQERYDRIQQVCPGDYTWNGASSCYWKVTTPDGWVHEYGKTRDSAHIPAGGISPHEWALNKVSDPNGNYYTITYDYDAVNNANGEYHPLKIEYTRSVGITDPVHSVDFVWESRPDVDISYRGGNAPVMSGNVLTNPNGYFSKYTKRLARVEVRSGTNLQRKFDFLYHDESGASCGAGAGGKSRLCSVRQYGTDGTTALPALTFQYQGGDVTSNFFSVASTQNMNQGPGAIMWLNADFNGDGRDDIGQVWESGGVMQILRYDSIGTGFANGINFNLGAGSDDQLYTTTMDVNGDQKQDVVIVQRRGWGTEDCIAIRMCLANATGFDACTFQNPGQLGAVPHWTSGGFRTVDVNGDGREDLVQLTESGTTTITYTYLSNGSGFAPATSATNSNIKQFPEWFPIDVNSDGKTDLVNMAVYSGGNPDVCETNLESNTWQVFLANGTNFNTSYLIGQNPCRSRFHQQFLPGDVNGDGITDFVDFRSDATVETYLSNGNGFRDPSEGSNSVWGGTPGNESIALPGGQYNEMHSLIDVNADKRSDLVRVYTAANDLSIATYTSRGAFTAPEGTFNAPAIQTFTGNAAGHVAYFFMDVDGDGQSDLVQAVNINGVLHFRLYKAHNAIPDLLTRVDNGIGGVSAVSYESALSHCVGDSCAVEPTLSTANQVHSAPMGWPNVVDNSPRMLVSSVKKSADNGNTFPYETRYTYYDGRRYLSTDWERRNKALGFRWMTSQDFGGGIAGSVDKTWWYQTTAIGSDTNDNNFKVAGLKWIATIFDSTWQRWAKTTYSYSVGGNITTSQTAGASQDTFARESSTLIEAFNANTLTGTTKVDNFYFGDTGFPANTGSVGQLAETHQSSSKGAPATVTLDTRTVLKYRENSSSAATCPEAQVSSPVRERQVFNASNQLLSHTKTTYRTSDCRPATTQAFFIEENRWVTQSTIGYDSYGNTTTVTDPRGATTTTAYLDLPSSPFHMSLPSSVKNHYNHETITLYNAWGRPTAVTDPNGVSTITSYDVLHRPTSVVRNSFVLSSTSYPSFTETRRSAMTDNAAVMQQVTTFTDGLGRESKVIKQSDNGSTAQNVYVCKQYDSKGRISAVSDPSFVDCSSGSPKYARTYYDAQGRVSYQTFEDGRPRIDYIYSGPHTVNGEAMVLQTTRASGEDLMRDELAYTDSRGRTRRTIRGIGSQTLTTDFSYDLLGRTTSAAIINGSTTSFTYDSLGRRRTVMDTGNTPTGQITQQITYNDAGDVVKTQDAGGKIISYRHDYLGRIVRECFGAATCEENTTPAATNTYDSATYGKGKLALSTTPASSNESATTTTYTYDGLARLATQTLQIDAQSFTTRFVYDGNDAIRCRVNPDNSFVRYSSTARNGLPGANPLMIEFYDTNSNGDCMVTYTPDYSVIFGGYDARGKASVVDYRKGTTVANRSTQTYTTWGGLATVSTRVNTVGDEIEKLEYAYNDLLALSAITDQRSDTDEYSVDTNRSRAFRYDGMGRLVQAVSGYQSSCSETTCSTGYSAGSFNRSYGFDAAGNMSSKEGYTFIFDAQMKQRLIGGQVYGGDELGYNYDNSGNVSARVTCYGCNPWNYEYNHRNMLVSATHVLSLEERNTYIGETRVKKDYRPNGGTQRVQTYYVNEQFQVRISGSGTTTYTAYINAGPMKLASFTRTGSLYASSAPIAPIGSPDDAPFGITPVRLALANALVPDMGRFVGVGLLGALAVLVLRSRRHGAAPKSVFGRFALANSLVIVTIGFGVGCSGSDIEHDVDLLEGDKPTLDTQSLSGGTQNGVPVSAYFFFNDYLGSPAVITSASAADLGTPVSAINHGPYGDVINAASGGPDVTVYKFTGQELDEETGLYNFGARMYAPEIGRFLSADTVIDGPGDGRGYLRYAYAKGNPVALTDPTGHSTECNDDGVCKTKTKKGIRGKAPPSPDKDKCSNVYDGRNGQLAGIPPEEFVKNSSDEHREWLQREAALPEVRKQLLAQAANALYEPVMGFIGDKAGEVYEYAAKKGATRLGLLAAGRADSMLPIMDMASYISAPIVVGIDSYYQGNSAGQIIQDVMVDGPAAQIGITAGYVGDFIGGPVLGMTMATGAEEHASNLFRTTQNAVCTTLTGLGCAARIDRIIEVVTTPPHVYVPYEVQRWTPPPGYEMPLGGATEAFAQ